MRIIAICCFGERSSYRIVKKLEAYRQPQHIYVDSLKNVLKTYDVIAYTHDLAIVYGSISIFNKYEIRTYDLSTKIDTIWLCPQVQYRKPSIIDAFSSNRVPSIYEIEPLVFGRQDMDTLWKQIVEKV